MRQPNQPVTGAGLGLRRSLLDDIDGQESLAVDFFEVAPENWINVGGALGRRFARLTERHPFVCHGLSLSLGSPAPLDETFIRRVRQFLDTHNIRIYSEHLSYASDDGHLYDLMPIPFTEDAVAHVAQRIERTQDLLGRRIAVENVSYYAAPGQEMSELEFLLEVIEQADCLLLLDVNNIYVNSVNHGYDGNDFLAQLPADRVAYGHIAGHYNEADDLIVDTHGANVIGPVWDLLNQAYRLFGPFPTLLERDFNFPAFNELMNEVGQISRLQAKHDRPAVQGEHQHAASA